MNDARGQKILIIGLGLSGAATLCHLAARQAQLVVTDSRAQPAGVETLRAQFPAVEFRLGGLSAPPPLSQFAMAVVSPGVPLDEPLLCALRAEGVEIVGDIELFARAARAPVIGITGSNGKSTVTTLVGEMARAAGLRVAVGGNLGPPALDLLDDEVELYVLELSSFQLETTTSLRCVAASLLNLSPDHLDRHGTMAQYAAAKARIFAGCGCAIVNRDDTAVMALAPAGARSFGVEAPPAMQYGLIETLAGPQLALGEEALLPRSELKIFGLHNAANALAALALADAAGVARDASLAALRRFAGLPHRCAFVAKVAGVDYFNDSKGTNVGATLAALNGLPAPIVWLGGGQGKGQSFAELRPTLAHKARAAVLFGEDAALIENDIYGALPVWRETDLRGALQRARSVAAPGDRVLLSPACASFDQFTSYVDRGQQFSAAVQELT